MSALDKPAGEPAGTHEQGFLGKAPDPTPETNDEAHAAARAAVGPPLPPARPEEPDEKEETER